MEDRYARGQMKLLGGHGMSDLFIDNIIKSVISQVGYMEARLGITPDKIRLRSDIYWALVGYNKAMSLVTEDRLANIPVVRDNALETEYSIEIMGTLLE